VKREEAILIVEDEPNMQRVLRGLLRREGYRTLEVGDGAAALEVLAHEPIEAVLTDFKMPRMNGLELLAEIRQRQLGVPVILLTAHGTIGGAVEALKHGAFDYLTKPFDPDEIQQVVAKAVRTHALQKSEATVTIDDDPDQLLLGESDALRRVKHLIERVAPTPATVLITGESGTGKELVARSLHLRSPRASGPFVKINCAAIPEGLLESELFGHEKGAFTGAARRKLGRFELADGGTLFLDEIGEMPLASQPKLLRAIQDGRFYHVGGTHTIDVDVRLVAATNRDLEQEVKSARFREDLFYRLNVVPIRLPALRERRSDIPALAKLFVARFARRHNVSIEEIDDDAAQVLCAYAWPGNIRELENAIERAVLLCEGNRIGLADLPPEMVGTASGPASAPQTLGSTAPLRDRIRDATRQIERDAIEEALRATNGNVTQAARRLGLSRRGLQLKMKELEIARGEE
jgi:two-component system, NtrC family, response regulator AtoC